MKLINNNSVVVFFFTSIVHVSKETTFVTSTDAENTFLYRVSSAYIRYWRFTAADNGVK